MFFRHSASPLKMYSNQINRFIQPYKWQVNFWPFTNHTSCLHCCCRWVRSQPASASIWRTLDRTVRGTGSLSRPQQSWAVQTKLLQVKMTTVDRNNNNGPSSLRSPNSCHSTIISSLHIRRPITCVSNVSGTRDASLRPWHHISVYRITKSHFFFCYCSAVNTSVVHKQQILFTNKSATKAITCI